MSTILIVDDDPVNRLLARAVLKDKFAVLEARNGQEALNIAKTIQLDLILMDMVMPAMDGLTAIKWLKEGEETKDIPIVVISGQSSPEDIERARALGVAEYISKPFNILELPELINRILEDKGE